jgi:hypothetical protein
MTFFIISALLLLLSGILDFLTGLLAEKYGAKELNPLGALPASIGTAVLVALAGWWIAASIYQPRWASIICLAFAAYHGFASYTNMRVANIMKKGK